MKPRLLDLFCGAGGAAMGYSRAGFDVVGVDIRPQPRYPFFFVLHDAIDYLDRMVRFDMCGSFDAIHASPPCQRWSSKTKNPEAHPDLITDLRPLLQATGLPYVIENVFGAPIRHDVMLCGSSFGLGVRRHRFFETNLPTILAPPCAHQAGDPRYPVYDHGKYYRSRFVPVYGSGGGKAREHWADAMDIDWMTDSELAEAIPPAYTELIGHQLMAHVKVAA